MKLKFMLVPLAIFWITVGCVNNQPKFSTNSKWFSPTEKQLTWKKADRICRYNGGRLATIEELKEVVIDCGGDMNDGNSGDWKRKKRNSDNDNYQSCYKRKGFRSSHYWSSTSFVGGENFAWVVYFNYGYVYGNYKNGNYYVRCVRDGQ